MKNKKVKLDKLLSHIGKSDITYLVNFNLLKEYFEMKNLTVKNIVTQKFFLEKMGIIDRAKILEKNMNNKEKSNMFLTLKRLLDKKFAKVSPFSPDLDVIKKRLCPFFEKYFISSTVGSINIDNFASCLLTQL